MGIIETNESDLRQLLPGHSKAIVMFRADLSAACDQLQPIYELFATNQAYAGIAFLRVNASESNAIKQTVQQKTVPFFVSYVQGRMVHCDTLHTEQQLRGMLHALQQHTEPG